MRNLFDDFLAGPVGEPGYGRASHAPAVVTESTQQVLRLGTFARKRFGSGQPNFLVAVAQKTCNFPLVVEP